MLPTYTQYGNKDFISKIYHKNQQLKYRILSSFELGKL